MSELVMRGHHNDHVVLTELLSPATAPLPTARLIRRVVVDATAVANQPQFARAAVDRGTQFLIDPMTYFMLERQAPTDSWAKLSFATPAIVPIEDLLDPRWQRRKVVEVVQFQLEHGATAVIPPYIHLERTDSRYARAQNELYLATANYLSDAGLDYEVVPILSVDRHPIPLEVNLWEAGMGRLLRTAASLGDQPVAVALSATSKLTAPAIHKMAQIWRRTAAIAPFIAWHAGDVGPLAVTLGANGYETGLCSTERCNVHQQLRGRRPSDDEPGPRWHGVYVDALGRSLGLPEVRAMSTVRTLQGDLGCTDPACCPHGFTSLLGPTRRQHAARSRLAGLAELDAVTARRWKLHILERRAAEGRASASRLRHYANAHGLKVGAYPTEFEAMEKVVQGLRATAASAVA